MNPILITACSNRKTMPAEERLSARDLPSGTLKEVASLWRAQLKNHPFRQNVEDLYNGRGASEASTASSLLCADQWFLSAGLGLVSAEEIAPGYDLTVSGIGSTSIKTKITDTPFRASDWWHEILKRRRPSRSISRLIEDNPERLIILGIPTNYLNMVHLDLASIDHNKLKFIRLIGPPCSKVPDFLMPYWLPYDERLDGPNSPLRGTRSDFPQRATRHFAENIWPHSKRVSVKKHFQLVTKVLESYGLPVIPKRTTMPDMDIMAKINSLWERAEGKSSRMLRILRDDELIACEQGRFKILFHEVKKKRS